MTKGGGSDKYGLRLATSMFVNVLVDPRGLRAPWGMVPEKRLGAGRRKKFSRLKTLLFHLKNARAKRA